MNASLALRALGAVTVAVLLGLCFRAFDTNIIDEIRRVVAGKWGLVAIADLYAGLLLMAALVLAFERDWRVGAAVAVAILSLGNIATGAWLVWRGPEILRRLRLG